MYTCILSPCGTAWSLECREASNIATYMYIYSYVHLLYLPLLNISQYLKLHMYAVEWEAKLRFQIKLGFASYKCSYLLIWALININLRNIFQNYWVVSICITNYVCILALILFQGLLFKWFCGLIIFIKIWVYNWNHIIYKIFNFPYKFKFYHKVIFGVHKHMLYLGLSLIF